jgi:hypothetical protein
LGIAGYQGQMSVLFGSKADIQIGEQNVRFVPIADIRDDALLS